VDREGRGQNRPPCFAIPPETTPNYGAPPAKSGVGRPTRAGHVFSRTCTCAKGHDATPSSSRMGTTKVVLSGGRNTTSNCSSVHDG